MKKTKGWMPPKSNKSQKLKITLSGGPYSNQEVLLTPCLGTFVFTAKGMTGLYNHSGAWSNVT